MGADVSSPVMGVSKGGTAHITRLKPLGLIRRYLSVHDSLGEGRLTTHCCRFPHDKGWTAGRPKPAIQRSARAGVVMDLNGLEPNRRDCSTAK